MTHKRMIVTGLAAFAVGAAGLSMFSYAEEEVAIESPEQMAFEPEAGEDIDRGDISYALGYRVGLDLRQQGIEYDVDTNEFADGIAAALGNDDPRMDEQALMQALFTLQLQMQARQQERGAEAAEASRAFLEQNREAEGVQVTDSGLQYRIIEEGEGDSPERGDTVVVHYRGTLVTGEQFDSSHDRGEPAEFPTDQVIPGWTEALMMMKPGAKWELFIPSELGYGERGAGSMIPPNAALIFEVELLEVK
ncbi:FKBP-type peptidyl-prolyl cis-trans isomerase [Phycisphaerales bacterium AB-hyl4]|uniref:Peptidyl-prolyl cis-trans isomerase n=1 Tax=Natronomicrosphaera hydrolytica TaxID=3242702 RepID=A0ABV4U8X0_9BACT